MRSFQTFHRDRSASHILDNMKFKNPLRMAALGLVLGAIALVPGILLLFNSKAPDYLMLIAIIWFLFILSSAYNIYLPGTTIASAIGQLLANKQRKPERSAVPQSELRAIPSVHEIPEATGERFNFATQQWEKR